MKTLPITDVVIIGMGAAGGIASHVLTQSGLRVVGLEAGPRLGMADFIKQFDEIGGNFYRNRLGDSKFNHELPTWRPSADAATREPLVHAAKMMNAVGGSSIHYGGNSYRFTAGDFKVRTQTVDRYGVKAIPENSTLADWPISYADLEPYYDKVEYLIGVSGKAGANPFESPRSRAYPMPPLQSTGFSKLAGEAMSKLGYHPYPVPAAITSQPYRGRPACSYCGFCAGYGCWNNSKSSTLVTAIAEAEKTGKLDLRPNCRVTRILSNGAGKASGVEYLDAAGQTVIQPAGVVILSAYIFENVRLLLLSTSKQAPQGLSNNHGQVGRNYLAKTFYTANGLFPGKRLNTASGTSAQATAIDDFAGDNFDHSGLGFIRGATLQSLQADLPIGMSKNLPPGVARWGSSYKRWLHDNANSVGAFIGQQESLPYTGNFLDLDPERRDPLGLPVIRVTYDIGDNERKAGAYLLPKIHEILKAMGASQTWTGLPPMTWPIHSHVYGGARMGDDPATSVVDSHCLSHEVSNLAVLSGAVFASSTNYNPTETIQALSWRAADHIAAHFSKIAV